MRTHAFPIWLPLRPPILACQILRPADPYVGAMSLLAGLPVKSDQHLAAIQIVAAKGKAGRSILLRLEGDDAVAPRAAIIPRLDLRGLHVVLGEDLLTFGGQQAYGGDMEVYEREG